MRACERPRMGGKRIGEGHLTLCALIAASTPYSIADPSIQLGPGLGFPVRHFQLSVPPEVKGREEFSAPGRTNGPDALRERATGRGDGPG